MWFRNLDYKAKKEEIEKDIEEQLRNLEWLPKVERNKQIREVIRQKYDIVMAQSTFSDVVNRIERKINSIGENLKDAIDSYNEWKKPEYEVIEHEWELHYILESKNYHFRIPVSEIDAMFKDFSAKGNNLSGEQMRQKYKLKPQAWEAIKRRLSLYKTSHVVSPYTLENLSEEEESALVEKAIADHIDSKVDKFVNTYDKQFKSRAEKALKTLWNFEYQLELVREAIELHNPINLDFVPAVLENNEEEHVIITDIHLGKIGTDDVIKRLDTIYNRIIASNAGTIHITCLGDLAESLTDNGMHPGQHSYGMDWNFGFWFDWVMKIVDIFERWLYSIAKSGKRVFFRGLTGNHWRFTESKADDHWRTWELVIYEMLKRGVKNLDVEVDYFKDFVNTFVIDWIEYIAYHGDWFLDKQKPEQIIVPHSKTWFHKVLISWDKHSMKMQEWANYTWIKSPALAWLGRYDTDLNLHSEPWYLQIVRNEFNTPDITIKRLK